MTAVGAYRPTVDLKLFKQLIKKKTVKKVAKQISYRLEN